MKAFIAAAIAFIGLSAFYAVLLGTQKPNRERCEVVGWTSSTLLEGTTRSGEHVTVYSPSRAVCKYELTR